MSSSRIKFANFTSHKTLLSLLNTKLVRIISKVTTAVRLQMGSKVQIDFDTLHVRHERYFSQLIWRSLNSASQAKTQEFQMFDALILISGGRLYPNYSVIHIVFNHTYTKTIPKPLTNEFGLSLSPNGFFITQCFYQFCNKVQYFATFVVFLIKPKEYTRRLKY